MEVRACARIHETVRTAPGATAPVWKFACVCEYMSVSEKTLGARPQYGSSRVCTNTSDLEVCVCGAIHVCVCVGVAVEVGVR